MFEANPEQDFGPFPERCVNVVGGKEHSAKDHFMYAGLTIGQTAHDKVAAA